MDENRGGCRKRAVGGGFVSAVPDVGGGVGGARSIVGRGVVAGWETRGMEGIWTRLVGRHFEQLGAVQLAGDRFAARSGCAAALSRFVLGGLRGLRGDAWESVAGTRNA